MIGSDKFKNLLRKLRFDKDIKGVVLRVNSPGGSALASEVIWREISLLRKEKPVVVSMGDVAASGGYYIACNADQVFANANT
ncbi:S49 family peptidase, partial [Staphylococcus aureus]